MCLYLYACIRVSVLVIYSYMWLSFEIKSDHVKQKIIQKIKLICFTSSEWIFIYKNKIYNCCFVVDAPRTYSKQHEAFLCGSHLAFSSSILLESRWCNHILVLTLLQFERNSVLFYQRGQISIWLIACQYHDFLMPM